MEMLVLDPKDAASFIESRSLSLGYRFDEVWEGVYYVSPQPNDEHQDLVIQLTTIFQLTIGWPGLGLVRPSVNISDRDVGWEKNYRCPDVAVYLNGTTAQNRGAYWLGGPDFLVEILSKYDKSREKLDFYAKVNSREVLILDRYPWGLEFYRLVDGRMTLVGQSTLEDPRVLASEVLPLTFRLVPGEPRPQVEVVHSDGIQSWSA